MTYTSAGEWVVPSDLNAVADGLYDEAQARREVNGTDSEHARDLDKWADRIIEHDCGAEINAQPPAAGEVARVAAVRHAIASELRDYTRHGSVTLTGAGIDEVAFELAIRAVRILDRSKAGGPS